MASVTYKCPNCGGGLVFDPQSQKFQCEYCMSSFTEKELQQAERDSEAEQVQDNPQDEPKDGAEETKGSMALFVCPSCGAEIVTDETTAATFCYYCHNPVVLSGRLEGKFKPDKVIPFVIDKEAATAKFLEWAGKKKFIPTAFFSKKQIEKITGIYFPYWIADCDVDTELSGKASKVRVWRSGDIEYTERKDYHVEREAQIDFDGVIRQALEKETEAWVENVQPFEMREMKNFNEAYLLGFQAEKRNIEKETVKPGIVAEVKKQADSMVYGSVKGYQSVKPDHLKSKVKEIKWNYTLFPVWILTYRKKGGKVYYYAMNGQTGKISGSLPIDKKKLGILSACITAVCTIIMAIGALV